MTKQNKIDYIEQVRARIEDAPNHGHNGNNWWYPTPWTIAYDVKMREYFDVDRLRALMSPLQNEHYSDDERLYDLYDEQLSFAWDALRDELTSNSLVVAVHQAGRSGGWCEVTYTPLYDIDGLENATASDVHYVYQNARALDACEQAAANIIRDQHAALNEYIAGDAFYRDALEQLMTDDDIRGHYENKAAHYLSLAKQ